MSIKRLPRIKNLNDNHDNDNDNVYKFCTSKLKPKHLVLSFFLSIFATK